MVTPTAVQTEMLTIEEFVRLSETQGPFEILNGERVKLMPTVSGHGETSKKVFKTLLPYEMRDEGEVFQEVAFVLVDSPDWVRGSRIPDVMYYVKARIATYKAQTSEWQKKPFVLVPDLVVEVVSENDNYADLANKVRLYLQDGVKLIWLMDPKHRTVTVYQPQQPILFLDENDTLRAGDILPGFEIPVASLFA